MKILYKLIIVSLIIIFMQPYVYVYGAPVQGTDGGGGTGGGTTLEGGPGTYKPSVGGDAETITNMGGKIVGAVSVVGSVVSLATLIYIGIKYMVGSVEERADYKKTLVPWLIGAAMVFAITLLPSIIYKIVQSAFPQ